MQSIKQTLLVGAIVLALLSWQKAAYATNDPGQTISRGWIVSSLFNPLILYNRIKFCIDVKPNKKFGENKAFVNESTGSAHESIYIQTLAAFRIWRRAIYANLLPGKDANVQLVSCNDDSINLMIEVAPYNKDLWIEKPVMNGTHSYIKFIFNTNYKYSTASELNKTSPIDSFSITSFNSLPLWDDTRATVRSLAIAAKVPTSVVATSTFPALLQGVGAAFGFCNIETWPPIDICNKVQRTNRYDYDSVGYYRRLNITNSDSANLQDFYDDIVSLEKPIWLPVKQSRPHGANNSCTYGRSPAKKY